MHDDVNFAKVDALEIQIESLIRRASADDPELGHGDLITALILSAASALLCIECPGCRELSARTIETKVPELLEEALVKAREKWGEQPSSGHIH